MPCNQNWVQGKPIFSSAHAWTGMAGLALLALQASGWLSRPAGGFGLRSLRLQPAQALEQRAKHACTHACCVVIAAEAACPPT